MPLASTHMVAAARTQLATRFVLDQRFTGNDDNVTLAASYMPAPTPSAMCVSSLLQSSDACCETGCQHTHASTLHAVRHRYSHRYGNAFYPMESEEPRQTQPATIMALPPLQLEVGRVWRGKGRGLAFVAAEPPRAPRAHALLLLPSGRSRKSLGRILHCSARPASALKAKAPTCAKGEAPGMATAWSWQRCRSQRRSQGRALRFSPFPCPILTHASPCSRRSSTLNRGMTPGGRPPQLRPLTSARLDDRTPAPGVQDVSDQLVLTARTATATARTKDHLRRPTLRPTSVASRKEAGAAAGPGTGDAR